MDYLTLKINKIKLYNSISTNQINRNRELLIYNYKLVSPVGNTKTNKKASIIKSSENGIIYDYCINCDKKTWNYQPTYDLKLLIIFNRKTICNYCYRFL